ncbi:hypothetical protein ACROYT_G000387 [Oculina patagonica]
MERVMDEFGRRRIHSAEALDSLRLKNSRSGHLSRITTLYRATEALLVDARNVEEVSKKLLEINEAFSRFEESHFSYIASLSGDLEEWAKEGRYFQEHCQRKDQFDLNIKRWIDDVKIRSETREETDIRPEDSVSEAGSRRSRISSSVSIKQLKAKEALARLKTDSVDSEFAIVEDVLDKLGSTIRQGFALPKPDLSTFDGNPMEYRSFIRSFENTIERNATSESEKLMYLLQYTTGEAKKTIDCCVVMDLSKGYQSARKLLKERFGHPYTIAAKFVSKITEGPPIKASDRSGLLAFADQLKNCEHTLESIGYIDEVNSADNLRRIVQRLPCHLRTKFVEVADGIQQSGKRPNIKDISSFVAVKARAANNPVFGSVMDVTPDSKRGTSKQRPPSSKTSEPSPNRITTLNTQGTVNSRVKTRVCPACSGNHILMKCQNFGRKTFDERVQIMRRAHLCHNCFQYGHIARGCLSRGACQVDGCTRKHHTLLHPSCQQVPNGNQASGGIQATQATIPTPTQGAQGGQLNSTQAGSGKVCLRIVPVKVQCQNSSEKLLAYALLDNGSDVSLCTKGLAARLGVQGEQKTFYLTTQEKEDSPKSGQEISLTVEALDGSDKLEIQRLWTVDKVNASSHSIPTNQDISSWPHLQDINLLSIEETNIELITMDAMSQRPFGYWKKGVATKVIRTLFVHRWDGR